ncbi:hypothetical protein MmiAt1_08610 [Methanimicrococcus sp. At1]|uniref:DUF4382 domain-containing protein n=1 Tax=Methanimicrococcus hacksteinii TaxID=3028293 RepID=A0ABU3VPE9_9EURY|nr:hypothetical protein [Methanimicrococcus sp. At1]MDV0445293.1 hypothetical protein [Methanimicrococcus sp. At1]
MKFSHSLLFGFLIVLVIVFCGCLGADDADDADDTDGGKLPEGGTIVLGESSGAGVFSNGDDLFVKTATILRDPENQTVLTENITVSQTGNTIFIRVPVYQIGIPDSDYIVEHTDVSVGKISDFDDRGDFIVSVNDRPDDDYYSSVRFSVEDGGLYRYEPAALESGQYELDGDDIVHVVVAVLFDSNSSVARDHIIQPEGFDENNSCTIYLPVKTGEGGHSVDDRRSTVRFVVGNQKELAEGEYTVSVNGNDLPFSIENHEMINELSYNTIWCPA